ncbi:hypothetical protein N7478_007394 [Penicillium angulare]|uniref:uncharacterized protein n=1 Tax=Penicillium angulare TaxID=116970 RepID=UPI002541EB1B|nr:uncharacterized protein N7478_007394 [Penicillium angulare]KAJ5272269.1 hypothetical protein N7478_007394 [Penicillium angulare]
MDINLIFSFTRLQQAIVVTENTLAENQKLMNEIRLFQQQVESMNATSQDDVPWNDIQLVLHQTHDELVSATTRYRNAIDALQTADWHHFCPALE